MRKGTIKIVPHCLGWEEWRIVVDNGGEFSSKLFLESVLVMRSSIKKTRHDASYVLQSLDSSNPLNVGYLPVPIFCIRDDSFYFRLEDEFKYTLLTMSSNH